MSRATCKGPRILKETGQTAGAWECAGSEDVSLEPKRKEQPLENRTQERDGANLRVYEPPTTTGITDQRGSERMPAAKLLEPLGKEMMVA